MKIPELQDILSSEFAVYKYTAEGATGDGRFGNHFNYVDSTRANAVHRLLNTKSVSHGRTLGHVTVQHDKKIRASPFTPAVYCTYHYYTRGYCLVVLRTEDGTCTSQIMRLEPLGSATAY